MRLRTRAKTKILGKKLVNLCGLVPVFYKNNAVMFSCVCIYVTVSSKVDVLVFFERRRINTFLCSTTTFQHTSNQQKIWKQKESQK